MQVRKAQDDVMARGAAEHFVADRLPDAVTADPMVMARDLLGDFPAVAFETVSKKISADETVFLRRVVITGPWEVDPNGA